MDLHEEIEEVDQDDGLEIGGDGGEQKENPLILWTDLQQQH